MSNLFSGNYNLAKALLAVAMMQSTPVLSDVIFQDDFGSGAFSGMWSSQNSVTIIADTISGRTTSNVASFKYKGKADGEDSMAELRFDLGTMHPQLSIQFDMYIPENYHHRTASPSNNKFFRLWPESYNDKEKLGSSMQPDGSGASGLGPDYSTSPTWPISTAVGGATPDFISAEDKGKWISVIIDVVHANGDQKGYIRISKNSREFFLARFNNDYNSSTPGYRYGYLLGWANSGHDVDTYIYIDNAEFHDIVSIAPLPPVDVIIN
jgi:hypothetical protein